MARTHAVTGGLWADRSAGSDGSAHHEPGRFSLERPPSALLLGLNRCAVVKDLRPGSLREGAWTRPGAVRVVSASARVCPRHVVDASSTKSLRSHSEAADKDLPSYAAAPRSHRNAASPAATE